MSSSSTDMVPRPGERPSEFVERVRRQIEDTGEPLAPPDWKPFEPDPSYRTPYRDDE